MDSILMCFCGNGKMEVRCAGEGAKHRGRYYYKCPLGNKHTRRRKQLEVVGILVFGFMAIVFVLFGILIGKIMHQAIGVKGNSDLSSPSDFSDAASFVSERVKDTPQPEEATTSIEEQDQEVTPLPKGWESSKA
ncbi:hypothetical protein SASPL_145505 [Salvia splendens]|uniref:Uncharacterized protein n=1 Tax=Salvia splendens TaxID=180675 RepID=A0A8X8WJ07_SALSN|nr:hypothetical protein SASPL_145505 [Salvia splendens]